MEFKMEDPFSDLIFTDVCYEHGISILEKKNITVVCEGIGGAD